MSLTDDWKAGKLKAGSYYVRLSNGRVDVAKLSKFNRFYTICYTFEVVEVLAPCDYDHFVELTEKAKKFEKAFTKALKYNDDLLAVITGCELEVNKLRELLKEVKEFIEEENPKDYTIMSERMDELLTKIEEALK